MRPGSDWLEIAEGGATQRIISPKSHSRGRERERERREIYIRLEGREGEGERAILKDHYKSEPLW